MRQFIRKNIWAVAPVVFVLVALVLLGSPLSSSKVQETPAEDDNLIVVGVSQVGSESVWRSAHTQSIQDAFTWENGYMLIFDNARQKQANQIKAIRSFISQQVDYIVLSPIEESGWDTVLQEAKDAGIPVILIDRKVSVDGEFTTAKGKEEMARLLDQYDDIDVVVSQNDDMTFGALEAIREAGKTAGVNGDITVISFDSVDAGVELVRNGEINIDVQCNPDQGKYVEQIIQDMEDGKEIEKAYYVPERVYTQENVGEEENVTEGISG